ncbi:GNAT family N-acetyltransferase [Halosimplex pelagicum]|uniref:GNAT family N-acetyltransferase n=1 Tax=Halosimplex pelagicum TaxID=869886 RepID=A0A7D5P931_9EURY|nr:GNAT family N-acetyltransferase [Halosimplex pelagicum]QLH83783.1 GNAT family N-acetyltransferase [Halosimplex pelagicum]
MKNLDDPIVLPAGVELRSAEPIDRCEIESLWESRTGFEISQVLDGVFHDEKPAYGFVATKVETVLGFGVVICVPRDSAEERFSISLNEYPLGEEVAVFQASAVREDWEGKGIGSALMDARLRFTRKISVDSAIGTAWLRPHTVDSSILFEKMGFERLDTIENFYQTIDDERDCPDCGTPCGCSAGIYVWTPPATD